MAWQGDALAAVSAGRSVRGVHAMQPGLLGASHSLINTAAVPTAPSISPASAPGIVGLPTPHSQLCSVGKQGQAHIRATQLLSISIQAGRAQPEEVMRSPGWSPELGGKQALHVCEHRLLLQSLQAHREGHPARAGVYLPKTAATLAVGTLPGGAWSPQLEHLPWFWSVQLPGCLAHPSPGRRSVLAVGRRCSFV